MSFTEIRIDSQSSERMKKQGLRLQRVDTADRVAFEAWLQADARGFHGERIAGTQLEEFVEQTAYRRTTGVWDDSAAEPETPVATVSSWPLLMSVPGGMQVPAWAVSSVTVAPTHHRRGIARALLEGELRTAAAQNLPLTVLTASEATLYGRYGFGPATQGVDVTIQTRRVGWAGRETSGRLHLVSLQHIHKFGREILERAQLRSPGDVTLDEQLWGELVGVVGDSDNAKQHRAVRFDDADGVPQGFAIYSVKHPGGDNTERVASVEYLCSVTDDAYAGLWQYLLELDLVGSVSARLRPVDEPLLWLVANPRAVRITAVNDHLWVRILDLKDALEARRYSAPGRIVLRVSDPLGFAEGQVLLAIDGGGVGTITALEAGADVPGATAELTLGVSELGALYVGGISAVTLARAGRVTEVQPGSAIAFDAAFRSSSTPWLSTWF